MIINTGKKEGKEHIYQIKINDTHITIFTHNRDDGLGVCLKKAAEAVKKVK
jgi:hypothetical protein